MIRPAQASNPDSPITDVHRSQAARTAMLPTAPPRQAVGIKHEFPVERCCAISYIRLLFDDSMLKSHHHKYLHEADKLCNCGQEIEDVHYFLRNVHYTTATVDKKLKMFTIFCGMFITQQRS